MAEKDVKQMIEEYDKKTQINEQSFFRKVNPNSVLIIVAITVIAIYLVYLDKKDSNYFIYMFITGLVGLIMVSISGERKERGFIAPHLARLKLRNTLIYFQQNPSNSFYIPNGDVTIKDHYPEDDPYTHEQQYLAFQVFIQSPDSEIYEFTAKLNYKGQLMHWVESPFKKQKQKTRYMPAEEIAGALQAIRQAVKENK